MISIKIRFQCREAFRDWSQGFLENYDPVGVIQIAGRNFFYILLQIVDFLGDMVDKCSYEGIFWSRMRRLSLITSSLRIYSTRFDRMSLTGYSHPIVQRASRVSRTPPHHTLPTFLSLDGRKIDSRMRKFSFMGLDWIIENFSGHWKTRWNHFHWSN